MVEKDPGRAMFEVFYPGGIGLIVSPNAGKRSF